MNKKNKILICTLVAIAMIGIYINSNNRTLNQGENSELSQLTTLNNALEEELPLLIEFVTPT